MIVFFDTTFIIEVERKNKDAIDLAKLLVKKNASMFISTVTLAEIFTGAFLTKDFKKSLFNAKQILTQFQWVDVNAEIAIKTGEINALMISRGSKIEFPDIIIAASALINDAEYIVTENKEHFAQIPLIKSKVKSIKELKKDLSG